MTTTEKESTVNNAATIEKLHLLKLHGMERAFRALLDTNQDRALSPDEMLAHLVDLEWEDRHSRKTTRLTRAAGFRNRAVLAEVDFSVSRGIDRASLARLSDCSWLKAGKTVLVTGPCGVGKSFLIQALGAQACVLGYRTLYFNCGKLFQLLKEKRSDGGYRRFVARVSRMPLLILDDFGLTPLDAEDRLSLLEIIEDRCGANATVIASQIPVAKWFDVIGDPTIADAICDRVVHQAIRIALSGKSMRASRTKDAQAEACANPAS